MNPATLATRLLAVREGAPLIDSLPEDQQPRSLAEAYQVADHVVRGLTHGAGVVAGFKVGATATAGQHFLGLAAPFYGRVPAQRILTSGASWLSSEHAGSVEAEIGFLLGSALPPRAEEYSEREVHAALARAVPLLEVNRPSYAKPFAMGGLCLIADNGVTDSLIVGGPGVDSGTVRLGSERVRLLRNGEYVASGDASVVLGDPLHALVWLANALRTGDRGLLSGDVIASGALTASLPAMPRDQFEAEYTTLGAVAMTVA